jgi:peptidoglycan hydrolase-like protein with peptidoglycan-binding domain
MITTITILKRNALALATLIGSSVFGLMLVLPVSAHAALLTQQLDFGMTNSDVSSLQAFLTTFPAMYPSGLVTGYFGVATKAGVSAFQTANGLAAVGRVGPQTLLTINAQMGGSGAGQVGDISAPIMSTETVSTGTNSATISWSTNEGSRGTVMYGNTWPFFYATAPSVSTVGYGTNSVVTITGLQSHSTYYYVIQSVDSSGNLQETIGKPLITQ